MTRIRRTRSRYTWAFVALALAFVCDPALAMIRWDDSAAGGSWSYGYLASRDGQLAIRWDANAPSDDDRPLPPPSDRQDDHELRYTLEQSMDTGLAAGHTSGYRFTQPLPDDVFVSDPVPQALFLNATRGIQLVLYLKAHPDHPTPCETKIDTLPGVYHTERIEPLLEAELTMDGTIIAGAPNWDSVWWPHVFPERTPPALPDGYGACYFSFHPEVHLIPKDAVLKLTIRHPSQKWFYPYGLQGDHRSVLRFALYEPEEVYYRYPDLATKVLGDPLDLGAGGLLPGVFLLPALLLGRRRFRTGLALALLLSGALAGCLSDGRPGVGPLDSDVPPSGGLRQSLVPEVGEENADRPTGSIYGQVHDDLEILVPGVHVALLGSSQFAVTDGRGRFAFRDVPAGVHKLRFDKADHRTLEADVEVKARFVSRVEVTLYPLNLPARDLRPHRHNEWGGQTTIDFGAHELRCQRWQVTGGCFTPNHFRLQPAGDLTKAILRGTIDLEITLEWDEQRLGVQRLGLTALPVQPFGEYNWSFFAPRPKGVPFHIAVTAEMTDRGHAHYSQWAFLWYAPPSESYDWEEQRERQRPGYEDPSVVVKAAIHRGGAILFDPPHPDLWKGKDQLTVINAQPRSFGWSSDRLESAMNLPWMEPYPYEVCYNPYVGFGSCPEPRYLYLFWSAREFVPQGTKWLEVTYSQSRSTLPSFGWEFYAKGARTAPWDYNVLTTAGFQRYEERVGSTETLKRWRIPLEERDADAEYSTIPAWMFLMRPDDSTRAWADARAHPLPEDLLTGTLTVVAHRTPVPAG